MQGDVPIFARAHGTLMGAAIGDALGMPSQTLPVDQIKARYGQITDFVAPYDNHPVSHGLHAGQVTDDTEQTLLLARRLILGQGQIDDAELAKDLLSWEAQVKDRGLRDLLGPSSKAALDAMLSGTPITETGRNGTTNGAAMRITPIGIAFRVEPISDFVDEVQSACRLTHNTREAIAAAAAVAAVVSAGLEGRGLEAALEAAPFATARWLKGEAKAMAEFESFNRANLAKDRDGDLVFMAKSPWDVNYQVENNPELTFSATKER